MTLEKNVLISMGRTEVYDACSFATYMVYLYVILDNCRIYTTLCVVLNVETI